MCGGCGRGRIVRLRCLPPARYVWGTPGSTSVPCPTTSCPTRSAACSTSARPRATRATGLGPMRFAPSSRSSAGSHRTGRGDPRRGRSFRATTPTPRPSTSRRRWPRRSRSLPTTIPEDLARCLRRPGGPSASRALGAGRGPRRSLVRGGAAHRGSRPAGRPHGSSGAPSASGWGGSRTLGLRRSRGEISILLDTSLEPTGDFVAPLIAAFDDERTGIAGGWGVTSRGRPRVRRRAAGRGRRRRGLLPRHPARGAPHGRRDRPSVPLLPQRRPRPQLRRSGRGMAGRANRPAPAASPRAPRVELGARRRAGSAQPAQLLPLPRSVARPARPAAPPGADRTGDASSAPGRGGAIPPTAGRHAPAGLAGHHDRRGDLRLAPAARRRARARARARAAVAAPRGAVPDALLRRVGRRRSGPASSGITTTGSRSRRARPRARRRGARAGGPRGRCSHRGPRPPRGACRPGGRSRPPPAARRAPGHHRRGR